MRVRHFFHDFWPPLLLCALLVAAVYPFFLGEFYGTGDMRDVYLPLETFFREEMRLGHLPSWNADMAWGFPVIAADQIGFFYPPLLATRWLPIWLYVPFLFTAHLCLAALGMYTLIRRQGGSRAAAFVSGLAFSLSGFVAQHFTHLNLLFNLSWLPWQCVVAEALAQRSRLKHYHAALFAFVLSVPFLAGHLQIPFIIALTALAYFVYRRWQETSLAGLTRFLLVVSLGVLGVTAVQILPTAELARYSTRGQAGTFTLSQANQFSFPLYHVQTALFPRFFGNDENYWGKRLEIEYGFFIGTLPLLLGLYATRRSQVPHRVFMCVLAGGSFLLALGSLSPFRLIGLEPSLWIFSAPARWLLVTTFAGAVLAGHGLDTFLAAPAASRRRYLTYWLVIVTSLVLLANSLLWLIPEGILSHVYPALKSAAPDFVASRPEQYYLDKLNALLHSARHTSVSLLAPYTLLPLASLGLSLLVSLRRQKLVMLGIIAVELIAVAASSSPTISWQQLLAAPATSTALPGPVRSDEARLMSLQVQDNGDSGAFLTNPASRADEHDRAYQQQLLVPLTHTLLGVPGIEWPASLDLQTHNDALDELRSALSQWELFKAAAEARNIGVVVMPPELVSASDRQTVTEVDNVALVGLNPVPRASFAASQPNQTVTYQALTPTHIRLEVSTAVASPLIVRDTWYPGWRATVDGVATALEPAEDIFRSLPIAAGKHTIEMWYQPTWLYTGLGISGATLLLMLGSGILYYRGGRGATLKTQT
jgi:hypothetical protein